MNIKILSSNIAQVTSMKQRKFKLPSMQQKEEIRSDAQQPQLVCKKAMYKQKQSKLIGTPYKRQRQKRWKRGKGRKKRERRDATKGSRRRKNVICAWSTVSRSSSSGGSSQSTICLTYSLQLQAERVLSQMVGSGQRIACNFQRSPHSIVLFLFPGVLPPSSPPLPWPFSHPRLSSLASLSFFISVQLLYIPLAWPVAASPAAMNRFPRAKSYGVRVLEVFCLRFQLHYVDKIVAAEHCYG